MSVAILTAPPPPPHLPPGTGILTWDCHEQEEKYDQPAHGRGLNMPNSLNFSTIDCWPRFSCHTSEIYAPSWHARQLQKQKVLTGGPPPPPPLLSRSRRPWREEKNLVDILSFESFVTHIVTGSHKRGLTSLEPLKSLYNRQRSKGQSLCPSFDLPNSTD